MIPSFGSRRFTDGTTRPVYRVHQGQYILDDAGGPVRSHWLLTEDDGLDFEDWSDVPLTVGRGCVPPTSCRGRAGTRSLDWSNRPAAMAVP